jgi:hypothetical protein
MTPIQTQLAERLAALAVAPVAPHMRALILQRDQHTCRYCRSRATEVDHFVPRAKGGLSSPQNLVAACQTCNRSKGKKTYTEWVVWKRQMALAAKLAQQPATRRGRGRLRPVRRIPSVLAG